MNTLIRKWLIVVAIAIPCLSRSQQKVEDSLYQRYNKAINDEDRIKSLGALSDYYYANKNFSKGDSLIEKQIMLAEATMNQKLVLAAFFGNAGYRYTQALNKTKDRSQNITLYINRALEYAKANNLYDYLAMASSNLAALNSSDGQLDEALKNANLGFTTALNTDNDSAKVICAIQLGNVYLDKADMLMAFKNYNNANDIAGRHKDESLLPPVFHAIANLYKKLGNDVEARRYVFRSLAINKKNKDQTGEVADYIFLAKRSNYTGGKEYLQLAIQLADSLHNTSLKIEAEQILFSHMLLQESPAYLVSYLDEQQELKNVFMNTGPDYLNWMMAEIYLYSGLRLGDSRLLDTALLYFKKAETSFNTGYDQSARKNFFVEFAQCLQQLKNVPAAITYYEKSMELSKSTADLSGLKSNSYELKKLYEQEGAYQQAFAYNVLYDQYKDNADQLAKEKDLALLEIDKETKRQEQQAELAKQLLQRKYNLQYMLITIIVVTAFVLLIMIGMFKVSTFTIRVMGFLSLIFLFEFIILLLDTWIHGITHGEPWKVWLIKIVIISLLLPIHHFLEHRLIRYLLSRHLITVRSRLSLSRFFGKKNKPLPEHSQEEDTI